MKLIFKTNTYGFHVEITNPLIAARIKEHLPLDSKVIKYNNALCVNINLDVAFGGASLSVREGDVVWDYSNSSLCIYLGSSNVKQDGISLKGIKAGHLLASVEEIRQLNNGDKISVLLLEQKNSYSDSRILSQSEI